MTFDVGDKQYCNYLRRDAIVLERCLINPTREEVVISEDYKSYMSIHEGETPTKQDLYIYEGKVIVHTCQGNLQIKPLFDENFPALDKYYIPAHKNKLEKMLIDTRCRFIKLEKLLNKYLEDTEKEYNKIFGELDDKYILKDTQKLSELDCEICDN